MLEYLWKSNLRRLNKDLWDPTDINIFAAEDLLFMQNRLRNLRLLLGVSQRQLASNLDVPVYIIKQLESESLPSKYAYLLKIAEFFQITTDSLLNFDKTHMAVQPPLSWDHQELLRIYTSLDEISKGKLYARAVAIAEESIQKNAKDFRGGGECCFRGFQILVENSIHNVEFCLFRTYYVIAFCCNKK